MKPITLTLVATSMLLSLLPRTASAVDFTWVGPDEGDFGTPAFWAPFLPLPPFLFGPGDADDTVNFNMGAAPTERYTVHDVAGTNEALYIHNDSVRMEISGYTLQNDSETSPVPGITSPSMIVGIDDGDVGDLVLTGTPGAILHSNRFELLGQTEGSTGRITVTGAGWVWSSSQIKVGFRGNGRLTIENGGTVTGATCHVGMFEGASGTAVVRGAGSSWTLSSLQVAHHDGTVIVEEGGTLTTNSSRIDGFPKGELIVRGAGSTWNGGHNCFVAYADTGVVRIEQGGVATATGDVSLAAWEPEGHATAIVTGSGSRWEIDEALTVGSGGTGIMTVEDGGTVSSLNGWLAWTEDATGTVSVHGEGSAWNIDEDLVVGIEGSGEVTVEAGGEISCVGAWLGQEPGSVGMVTIRGADSRWTNTGEIFLGSRGEGVLTVEAGGRVDNNGAWIGTTPGPTGRVTVRNDGSTWSNDGQMIVGYRSSGSLTVLDGGTATCTGNGFIGFVQVDERTSEVLVSGERSLWSLDGELNVGHGAKGTMTIAAGARVENTNAFIARNAGAEGTVVVTGEGSDWLVRGDLVVGEGGPGTLEVQYGAMVSATGVLTVEANGLVSRNGAIAGEVLNHGVVAPLVSLESLDTTGRFDQGEDGTLRIELASPERFARLRVNGDLELDGALEVSLADGFVPADGTEFSIFGWTGSLAGTFADLVLPGDVQWDTSRLYTEGVLVAKLPQTDTDKDRLWDAWELTYVKDLDLLHGRGDYDHDGQPDWAEQEAGTDPTDSSSALRLWVTGRGNQIVLRWTCVPTREYTVYTCENPGENRWQVVPRAEMMPGDSAGEMSMTVTPGAGKNRMFWRVGASLP